MINNRRVLDLALATTPLTLRLYATSKGWETDQRGYEYGLFLMKRADDPLRQLQIPMTSDSENYAQMVIDVAGKLGQMENRAPLSVLSDVLFVSSDVLRFGVASPESQSGILPLDGGISLLTGARQSILSSACSVVNPAKHHSRMTADEARKLVQSCLMDQTEHGSFIVKVACPIDALPVPTTEPIENSFVRKSTQHLLQSAARLVSIIQRDQLDQIEKIESESPLISSNFCESIVKMGESDEKSSVSISAAWSGLVGPPMKGTPDRVKFAPEYLPIIKQIGNQLRGKAESRSDTFVGTVEELRGDINDKGKRMGDVVLAVIYDGELVPARVSLDEHQHSLADDAYMTGAQIKVRGTMRPGARVHTIEEVAEFDVVK